MTKQGNTVFKKVGREMNRFYQKCKEDMEQMERIDQKYKDGGLCDYDGCGRRAKHEVYIESVLKKEFVAMFCDYHIKIVREILKELEKLKI